MVANVGFPYARVRTVARGLPPYNPDDMAAYTGLTFVGLGCWLNCHRFLLYSCDNPFRIVVVTVRLKVH